MPEEWCISNAVYLIIQENSWKQIFFSSSCFLLFFLLHISHSSINRSHNSITSSHHEPYYDTTLKVRPGTNFIRSIKFVLKTKPFHRIPDYKERKRKYFFRKLYLQNHPPLNQTTQPQEQCHPDQAARTHKVIPGQRLVEATHPPGIVIIIQTAMVLTTTKMTTGRLTTKTHLEVPLTHLQVGIKRTIDTTVSFPFTIVRGV